MVEPLNQDGSTCGKTYLRKGKGAAQQLWERGVREIRNSPVDTYVESMKKEGQEVLKALEQGFPSAHGEPQWSRSPPAPGGSTTGAHGLHLMEVTHA
ncbi:hypothetical protein HGM15179_010335 [Zosterops borbonicus]|uniref:Uncharacterized protein n=1 Tax=Zosterops borbonicus TaxID=364589 RepID=A0A8K1GET3_9PASS|nr:hypothetical protein HGM15179_010335 [Zosterops borbonicus]